MDVAGRLPRLRERFDDAGISALLITRLPNVRYLTGFTGSAGMVFVTPADAVLITDGRYKDQAGEQVAAVGADVRVDIGTTQARQREILQALAAGIAHLGLEAHDVSWAQQRAFASDLVPGRRAARDRAPGRGLPHGEGPGRGGPGARRVCRSRTTPSRTCSRSCATRRPNATSHCKLEFAMRERGASAVSFDPIVASGPNGAKPHARPSDRQIVPNELVVIDFGCIVDGYCSDMTRTVSVGDPGPDARRLWDTVLLSQRAGRDAVAVGVECAAVDKACRDVIDDAGWGDAFVHGTGHGVGLEIHEDPRVAATSGGTLAPGHVVTVEPGVYLPGVGGVRIEDTLVVTPDGPVALTEFPKDLVL